MEVYTTLLVRSCSVQCSDVQIEVVIRFKLRSNHKLSIYRQLIWLELSAFYFIENLMQFGLKSEVTNCDFFVKWAENLKGTALMVQHCLRLSHSAELLGITTGESFDKNEAQWMINSPGSDGYWLNTVL